MRDSWLQSYERLKKYLEPAAISTSRLLQLKTPCSLRAISFIKTLLRHFLILLLAHCPQNVLVSIFVGKVGYLSIVLHLCLQAGVLGRNTPRPALIPGDHQVIAFLAPCLVGFTFDLATYLFHPLKPNQIVVLLVVK